MKSWKSALCCLLVLAACMLSVTHAGDAARELVASVQEKVIACAKGPNVSALTVKDGHRACSEKMLTAEVQMLCDCGKVASVEFAAPQDCDEIVKTKQRKGYTKLTLKSGRQVELRANACGAINVDYDD